MTETLDLCESRVIHEDRIERARVNALGSRDIDWVTRIFKAMGDPTRLRILWALDRARNPSVQTRGCCDR